MSDLLQKMLVFMLLFSWLAFPQDSVRADYTVSLFPDSNVFPYLQCAPYEAVTGIHFYPDNQGLRVDLGSSLDAVSILLDQNSLFSLGIMFMAYAKIESYRNYRLQVQAIDGLFGGYAVYHNPYASGDLFLRFRFLHHSAHLVDGNYNTETDSWKDDREPVPYAKDFADFHISLFHRFNNFQFRNYGSVAYSVLVRPEDQKRLAFSFGTTVYHTINLTLFHEPLFVYVSYHGRLEGATKYRLNNSIKCGLRLGSLYDKGLEVFLRWYGGNDLFAEYYNEYKETFSIGFAFDMP